MVQISLFAFNLLLPAYPLDGGRVFADILRLCGVVTLTLTVTPLQTPSLQAFTRTLTVILLSSQALYLPTLSAMNPPLK